MTKIIIDPTKCTNCRKCVEVCPMKCYGLENDKVVVKDSSKCILCKACLLHCPHKAIEIKEY